MGQYEKVESSLAQILAGVPDPRFDRPLSDLDPKRATLYVDGVAQPVMRCGADVVSGLMLSPDDRAGLAQALDAWLASGRIGSPPFPPNLSIADARIAALRLASIRPPASRPPVIIGTPYRTSQPMQKSDNTPPQAVRDACRRGLELAEEHGGPGLTQGAKDRARSMANGDPVSDDTLKRISSFHARHSNYEKESSPPSPGYVAWKLWGGDAGRRWADANKPSDETAKSNHVREMQSGRFASQKRKTEKAKTPKWKRDGLVAPGGAAAYARREAKKRGKGKDYESAIYAHITGKR